jgi:hypothetical protein
LVARQSDINSLLDLDKGDQQGTDSAPDPKDEPDVGRAAPAASRTRGEVAKMAEAYMRTSGTAIREMPIVERIPPQTGAVTGRAVAKDETHIAVATAANSFFVVEVTALGREVEVGERLSLRFQQGRTMIDNGRDRGR